MDAADQEMRGVFVCVGVEPNANAACQLSGLKVHDAPPLPWGEGWGEGLGSLVDTMGPDTPHPARCADLSPWERFRAGVFFVAVHRGAAFCEDTRFSGHASPTPAMRPLSHGVRVGVRGWDLSWIRRGPTPLTRRVAPTSPHGRGSGPVSSSWQSIKGPHSAKTPVSTATPPHPPRCAPSPPG